MHRDDPDLPLIGAIEGGGSKFVCAVARGSGAILERVSVPTIDPTTTLADCVRFFRACERRHGAIHAFGFGCFGPIELRPHAAAFGRLLATPKSGWAGVDVLAPFQSAFQVPMVLDTDVGASALAELRLGAGRGLSSLAYVTVGTGIGGAIAPTDGGGHGLMHAEMGHLRVRRDPRDSEFAGSCPFHGDCLEGLASGTAIRARWGCPLDALPPDHVGRSIVAGYLGQLAAAIVLIAPVERIVFGGGVMSGATMLPQIVAALLRYLAGYIEPLRDQSAAAAFVAAPGLGDLAGITGALLLAEQALGERSAPKG